MTPSCSKREDRSKIDGSALVTQAKQVRVVSLRLVRCLGSRNSAHSDGGSEGDGRGVDQVGILIRMCTWVFGPGAGVLSFRYAYQQKYPSHRRTQTDISCASLANITNNPIHYF
ncbi:hypothetical protein NL676_017403 [Syzygium grande]|nr:hypothetical protein NL676_017403 [Syzygium grande]